MRDKHKRYCLSKRMNFAKKLTYNSLAVEYEIFQMGKVNMAIGIICNDGHVLCASVIAECLRQMEWDIGFEVKMFYHLNEEYDWKMYHKELGMIEFDSDNHRNEFLHVNNQLFLSGMISADFYEER